MIRVCDSCRGSGVAQYLLDDSGCPCGPVYPCDSCEGTGELVDWSEVAWGPAVHDTEPAPAPDFHERDTWPAPAGEMA